MRKDGVQRQFGECTIKQAELLAFRVKAERVRLGVSVRSIKVDRTLPSSRLFSRDLRWDISRDFNQ